MDSRDLIPGYLIHEGYKDTLEAFDRSEESAKDIIRRISELVSEKKWLDVISLLEKKLPYILESNTDLLFQLLGLEFVKILRSKNRTEAVVFARENFIPFRKNEIYEQRIEDCMYLLGYEEPNEVSPPPILLSIEHERHVTETLNHTIRYTLEALDPLPTLKLSNEEIHEIKARKEILECASKSHALEAIRLTENTFPGLFENNNDLRVELLTLEYLEHVRLERRGEAAEFSYKQNFHGLKEDPKYRNLINEVLAAPTLVKQRDTVYVLTPKYQKGILFKLNRAIRAYGNHPGCSDLESLIQRVLELGKILDKDQGKDVVLSASSLKNILNA